MQNDLISREEAEMCVTMEIKPEDTIETVIGIIHKRLKELPAVQPKKGKWIVISCGSTDIFKCSECGVRVINPYRYCHSCGAKMEVNDEER